MKAIGFKCTGSSDARRMLKTTSFGVTTASGSRFQDKEARHTGTIHTFEHAVEKLERNELEAARGGQTAARQPKVYVLATLVRHCSEIKKRPVLCSIMSVASG